MTLGVKERLEEGATSMILGVNSDMLIVLEDSGSSSPIIVCRSSIRIGKVLGQKNFVGPFFP